jgi:hypothetical protein
MLSLLRGRACTHVSQVLATRAYTTLTRRRVRAIRREGARNTRHMLEFAATFDPMRTARLTVAQTLNRMGWDFNKNERLSDGLYADFTLADRYCAIEVINASDCVTLGHADASNVPAMQSTSLLTDAAGALLLPRYSPFPNAPAPYLNPVQGLVLTKAVAERHDHIRSKGWKLVAIPQPFWEVALSMTNQHYARRDLLLSLTMPVGPFEPRPASSAAVGTKTSAKAKPSLSAQSEASSQIVGVGKNRSQRAKQLEEKAADRRKSLKANVQVAAVKPAEPVAAAGQANESDAASVSSKP